ncbi:MAG: hypothetical protein ABFS86_04165 [Planctomycetota bacterium]
MNCEDCGAELTSGTYYCGGCGRPVGFNVLEVATAEAEPGLDEVPSPAASLERFEPPAAGPEAPSGARVRGKGLCGMCMGAFPESVLSVIDGKPYCPDCSPVAARCRKPEVREDTPSAPEGVNAHPDVVSGPLLLHETRSGAGTKGLLAVFVLLLLAGTGAAAFLLSGSDRIDEMMSGLDTGRNDAYLLTQSYVPGESLHYGLNCRAKIEGEGAGVPFLQSGDFDARIEMLGGLSVQVLKVDGENNADLAVTTGDFDLDLDFRVGGKPVRLPVNPSDAFGEMAGKTVITKVDAFGNPVGGATGDGMQELLNGGFGEMPDHYIRVGDTWSARVPLDRAKMPGQPMALSGGAFVVEYRVEGFKRFRDRDCMAISMKGGLEGVEEALGPLVKDLKCDFGIKGVAFFDVGLGRLVKIAMDVDLDFGMAGQGGGLDAEILVEMDIDLK